MRLLRFIVNIVLAVILLCAASFVLATGYGYVAADAWEYEEPVQADRAETWLQVNGQPVHLTVAGPETGPVLVFVHGSDVEGGLTFASNIKALGLSGLRVIAIDFPGFGYSTRDTSLGYMAADQVRLLDQVLTTLGATQVTLVGFQRGCAVALGYALERSQNVKQIVLISPLVYHDARQLSSVAVSIPAVGKSLIWARNAGPLLDRSRRSGYADPTRFTDSLRETILSTTHISGTTSFQLTWMRDAREDSIAGLSDLGDLTMPVLILVGEQDKTSSAQEAEQLARTLADVTLVKLPDTGYYVHQDAYSEANQRLIQLGLHGIR